MAYDFPASPTPGQTFNNYVWDGEKWKLQSPPVTGAVRYDIAQGLNSTQKAQARANIDVAKKNYIINGAMQVSQENGQTLGTVTAGVTYYPADMFAVFSSSAGTLTTQQIPTYSLESGAINRLKITVTVADTSIGTTDQIQICQKLEGQRISDLGFGFSLARTVTLQFGVRAPAGTYCVSLSNGAGNRTYIAEYVITAGEANTDVKRSVTIPGDVTGTWDVSNGAGINVLWSLMCGNTYQQAGGVWGTTSFAMATANQFNLIGTVGNTFHLFDVSLTEGSVAPPFGVTDYASELALCRRYWERTGMVTTSSIATNFPTGFWTVEKRAVPTLTFSVDTGTGATYAVTNSALGKSFYQNAAHSSIATATITGNARL